MIEGLLNQGLFFGCGNSKNMSMNEKKWLKIVNQMPPMGMASTLAEHCHFGHYSRGKLGLHISVDHAHLITESSIETLASYLDEVIAPRTGLTIWYKQNEDLELRGSLKPVHYQRIKSSSSLYVKRK